MNIKRMRGRFFWKLFLGNALLLIGVVGSGAWLIVLAFERFYARETTAHLRTLAETLRYSVQDVFDAGHAAELDRMAKAISSSSPEGVRITLVLKDGTVLADSEADPAGMESHANRAEIIDALGKGWGESTRWSRTVARDMTYIAVRVGPAAAPKGVVRVSMAVRNIAARTQLVRQLLWAFALVLIAAAVVLALGLARMWSRPISRITETARSLSRGDLSARADVHTSDELGLLALSLNRMRNNLAGQLKTIDRHRRTLELLLAQLHEGVVVAGADGRIRLLNPAAARLLGVQAPTDGDGRGIVGVRMEDCVPHPDLREMLRPQGGLSASRVGVKGDSDSSLSLIGEAIFQERSLSIERASGGVSLLARASDIMLPRLEGGRKVGGGDAGDTDEPAENGRLLVLTDITELTRTIQVKSDFAANASHELRTPLAAIRAAIETVNTVDLAGDPSAARQYLGVIERHSNRLEAMVADLLDLSRLESPATNFKKTALRLSEAFEELHARFAARIEAKKLLWNVDMQAESDTVAASRHLLQLILDNLVDNAIKFTDEGGRIGVVCREADGGGFAVTLEDDGCGIPPEDHDRVFERFYQVERARSGTARGTGLGLSIVRHAVNALGGAVKLESAPGRGTQMTFTIPPSRPAERGRSPADCG